MGSKRPQEFGMQELMAIFVAWGFTQKEGIDYDETFAHVTRYTTIRTIISLDAVFGWKLHQMDVKTTFLNGKIDEEVYIEQPEGFVTHGDKSHVCKLKKALYGLKQAPRVWYARILMATFTAWGSPKVLLTPICTLRLFTTIT